MNGSITGKRLRAFAAAVLVGAVSLFSAAGIKAHAEYANVLDDRVFNNEYIVAKQDPAGKIGKTMNIPVVIKAPQEMDEVWVGLSRDINSFDRIPDDGADAAGVVSGYPFEINESTFTPRKLGKMHEGSTKSITLTAKVRRDMPQGYYCIPIDIYPNGKDSSPETDFMNVWVGPLTASDDATTTTANEDVMFVMGENQSTPYGTYPEVMNYSVNLRNRSTINAYDVTVSMVLNKSNDEFPFMINDANYDRHFDVIEAGETVSLPYSMAIRKDSYTGFYPIKYTISYRESVDGEKKIAEGPGAFTSALDGATQSTDTTVKNKDYEVYVHVTSKEKEDTLNDFNANDRTKARIIVDNFYTVPEKIMAGQEFELHVTMKNASSTVSASNILFTLESEKVSDTAVFVMDAGSSSVVVDSMGAGGTRELVLKLMAKAGVDQRSYAMTIKEKYDSPEFKNAEESVSVDIPVYQKARFSTSTIEVSPESIEVGSETNVMFGINNTGRILLYNVTAKFEADSIKTADAYVGNIKPGETGNVDIMLTGAAATADDGKVKIIVSYEDENGTVTEEEKELNLLVTEPMTDYDESDLGLEEEVAAPTGFAALWQKPAARFGILGGGAVLLLVIIGLIRSLIKKQKEKKQQKAEEEGIDDEIS